MFVQIKKTHLFFLVILWLSFSCPTLWADNNGTKKEKKTVSKITSKKTTPTVKKTLLFIHPKLGYSFLPPKGWMALPNKNSSLIVYTSPKKYPNLNIRVLGKYSWSAKKELMKALGDNIVVRYKNKYAISSAEVKILPWQKISSLSITLKGMKNLQNQKATSFSILQRIFFYKKMTVIFTFTSKEENFQKWNRLFQKTLQSFSIKRTVKTNPKEKKNK